MVPVLRLLADEAFRAHLIDTQQGLRSPFASAPLVLALSSPRAPIRDAYQLAFADNLELEVGGDAPDSCAVYVVKHYRWDIGLRFVSADGFRGELTGLDFVIAPG